MSRGRLKLEDYKCIQSNYVFLLEQLEAKNIVHYLFQHEVITIDDKEKIWTGKSQTERNETLLTILLNAGPGDAFNYFLKSLESQYSFILEKLQRKADEGINEDSKSTSTEVDHLKKELAKLQAALEESKSQCAQAKIEDRRKEEEIKKLRNQNALAVENLKIKEEEICRMRDKQAECMKDKRILNCFANDEQNEDCLVPLSQAVSSETLWKSLSMYFTPIKK